MTTTEGKVNVYQNVTIAAAITDFYVAMDSVCAESSCIKSVELFTKFNVNRDDSKVYETLVSHGLGGALK